MGIAHWDDVAKRRAERGQMAGTWSNLGSAAGSFRCGVTRLELEPGEMPTPPHVHGEAEEIFYVLAGSGLTWMDEKAYEVHRGDCIVYKNSHEAHTIRAGDEGLDVLAFGGREYLPTGELPRGQSMWTITSWAEVRNDSHTWDREPPLERPEPEAERPATIVNVGDVGPEVRGGRRRRDLARAAGSRWTGLKHVECDRETLAGRAALPFRGGGDLRRARRGRDARALRRRSRDASCAPRLNRCWPSRHRSRAHIPRG